MRWIEVSIQTTHEATEAVADIFHSLGAGGVVIEDPELLNNLRNSNTWELCGIPEQKNPEIVVVTAYFPDDDTLRQRLNTVESEMQAIEQRIGVCRFGNTRFRNVSEHDWANEWKQYFHVTRIGEQLVIKPTWEDYVALPQDKVIEIDPGMAFGTGTHHTTCMCMCRLEKVINKEATVFDVGTGSGILAIAAALLGAKTVKAVDIDGTAVRVATENVALNHLTGRIDVKKGDLLHGTEGQADVIIANIIADIIILLLPEVLPKLKPGGVFLASGIIVDRAAEVTQAARENGLTVEAIDTQGGWVVMQMRKEE
ncbi:MAG: 50S ribosomal protein L11 methyltransferase [Acidaminococcaceae bacterium]